MKVGMQMWFGKEAKTKGGGGSDSKGEEDWKSESFFILNFYWRDCF